MNERENVGCYSLTIVTSVFQVLVTLLFLILILSPTVTVFCRYTVMTNCYNCYTVVTEIQIRGKSVSWNYPRSRWRRWTELDVEGWVEFGMEEGVGINVETIGKGFGDQGEQKH